MLITPSHYGMRVIACVINLRITATVAQSNLTDQVKTNGNRNDGSKINAQTA